MLLAVLKGYRGSALVAHPQCAAVFISAAHARAPSEVRVVGEQVDPAVIARVDGLSNATVNPFADDGAVGKVPPVREQLHHCRSLRDMMVPV